MASMVTAILLQKCDHDSSRQVRKAILNRSMPYEIFDDLHGPVDLKHYNVKFEV